MQIHFNPSAYQPDALAILADKDGLLDRGEHPAGEAIRRALAAARFEGETATLVELFAPPGMSAGRLIVVGAGAADARDAHVFERVGGALAAKLATSGAKRLAVDVAGVTGKIEAAEIAARIAHGASLRGYRFDKYQTKTPDKKKPTLEEVAVFGADPGAEAAFARLDAIAGGVFFARDVVTEPGNIIYPESFVERAQVMKEFGVEVEALGPDRMRELGMGALLGVAQGSDREARMLVLRYDGTAGAREKPVVFVGKGVTFDTGGISIKPSAGMEDMKYDMAGAAAVAGAVLAIAARRAKAHVVGVCGLVENMPSGRAQRPGDVVTTMSGQTAEVLNTDAEGRLVLADALWYAQDRFKPEVVIDLATLTGAMVVALGNEYGGMFANDDGLATALLAAGTASGDKLWRMPLAEAYDKAIDSPIADMKNIGGREAGSATAAHFVGRFVQPGVKWAHLDIAGMAWAAKDLPLIPKGATGYGVRLLDRYVADNWEA